MVTKTQINLENKCRKALIEVTKDIKKIKQKLYQIENIEQDIDKKTSHLVEMFSTENIKKDYAALRQHYNDTIGYEE